MKTKVKKVYYCGYCGRHRLVKWAIEGHEKHCTLNPNRECRLCDRNGGLEKIILKYKLTIPGEYWTKDEKFGGHFMKGENIEKLNKVATEKLKELRDEVEGCPNCMLTVLRCNKYEMPINFEFDYKKELAEWWKQENEKQENEDEYLAY